MSELLSTVRGALFLDVPTYIRFRDSQDVFRRGLAILVLVALVAGILSFAVDFIGGLLAPPAEVEAAQAMASFERMLQFMPPEVAQAFEGQFLANFEAGMEIGRRIDALPTRLPKPVGIFLQALGGWVSRPLTMLGGFLSYGIWVMLAAKLLGGRGRLQEFLGTAALSALPYLLLILEKVPCLGGLLGTVAWGWGTVMWIVATAVAHGWAVPVTTSEGVAERYQVNWGRATLAVILPPLALVALVLLGLIVLAVMVALAN